MRSTPTFVVFLSVLLPSVGTVAVAPCGAAEVVEAAAKEEIVKDWMLQDHGPDVGPCFTRGENADIETKMLERVFAELGGSADALRAKMEGLVKSKKPGNDPAWKALYVAACEERRHQRLASLRDATERIVFAKHYNLGGSHYAYTEGLSDAQAERHFKPGTALCVLEMTDDYGEVRTLIRDEKGVIRDPDVSFDAKRILFSWKKSDREDDYHLYEMDVASEEVRQLTEGLGHADYEGIYLPNDDILFNSTRCVQIVDCWWTEVSNLYTCDKDGKYMRRLSFDQVHTNYPQLLNDGRVIYTRWDYNDRGQLYPQPLFVMNPDGTSQTEYYGNNSWFPTTIAHARAIPGSNNVLAIATGHHSIQTGALILLDVKHGRQETTGVTLMAPRVDDKTDRRYRKVDGYTGFNGHFCYPYPLNESEYIASYSATQTGRDSMNGFGLYYVREDGARELLALDPALSSHQPVFLTPRQRPRVQVTRVDYTKKTGTYYVQDVYEGPGLKGIERGVVKKLRVVGLEFRAAGVGSNGNGGPAGGALVSTPIAIRNGTWDVKVILGETPVHEDGSAHFEVPARTPLYFQLIDDDGHVVQSMRSWSTLQPGEQFSCLGCHEDKNVTGSIEYRSTIAMRSSAQPLSPFHGPPRGFSFVKEIQPILDRHCIKCHDDRSKTGPSGNVPDDKKAFSLLSTADKPRDGRFYSDAYVHLTQNGKPNPTVNWLNVQSIPPMLPPYFAGSAKSKLMDILREKHYEANLSRAELEKIACWIDLLVPYCGDYMEANAWDDRGRDKYLHFQEKRDDMEALERENIQALLKRK
ncbi:MAG: hypothetical protein HQ581_07400 [Planctomycetes bacterium]|nr:hypothetical protein [Planctomycetota bacterium]